jgi:hypothetical protein
VNGVEAATNANATKQYVNVYMTTTIVGSAPVTAISGIRRQRSGHDRW